LSCSDVIYVMLMKAPYSINWLIEQVESGKVLKYVFFWGHTNKYNEVVGKFFFSQWADSPFTVGNITYPTAEHWMMAHKALLFDDQSNFEKIIHCKTPSEAKEIGRQVLGYDEQIWSEKKFEIVVLGNIHKFNQYPQFADYLINTQDRILVEASPVDTIWGIGLSQDSKDIENIYAWRGQNLLGFALMATRDFMRYFGHFQPLKNILQAPWVQFPSIHKEDIFWRIGQGKDYLVTFTQYFDKLNDKEKVIYQFTNPAPYQWADFYDSTK
jgi:ribA/ribD-fused uncharacterized protein